MPISMFKIFDDWNENPRSLSESCKDEIPKSKIMAFGFKFDLKISLSLLNLFKEKENQLGNFFDSASAFFLQFLFF